MDEARLEALLREATAHCYDEEDEFWGVFSALVGRVSCPLPAQVGGEAVTLVGMDGPTSNLEAGVMTRIDTGGCGGDCPPGPSGACGSQPRER